GPDDDPEPPDPPDDSDDDGEGVEDEHGVYKVVVSGVPATIIHERIEYLGPDGKLITESYRDFTRKQICSEFASLDEFLKRWDDASKKQTIIDLLEEYGVVFANLAEEIGKDYGVFDMICHIAYDQPPLTRKERANNVKKRDYFTRYGEQARAVLSALLDKYADEGLSTLESTIVLKLRPFTDMGAPMEIVNNAFGSKAAYEQAIQDLKHELFSQDQSA
ncbi:MAG: restriction endonuclease, partial [Gammaproteobacteria bacterium]|nr:restriction endonuclease [Gammaproteobacteria bacterium]